MGSHDSDVMGYGRGINRDDAGDLFLDLPAGQPHDRAGLEYRKADLLVQNDGNGIA